jgi:hypothetical protein
MKILIILSTLIFASSVYSAGPLKKGRYFVKLCENKCTLFKKNQNVNFIRLNGVNISQGNYHSRYGGSTRIRLYDQQGRVRLCDRYYRRGGQDVWRVRWRKGGISRNSRFTVRVVNCRRFRDDIDDLKDDIEDALDDIADNDIDDALDEIKDVKEDLNEILDSRANLFPGNKHLKSARAILNTARIKLLQGKKHQAKGKLKLARLRINQAKAARAAYRYNP